MPTFRVTVLIDVDDVPITDFPVVRRIATTNESADTYTQVTGGGSVAMPHGVLVTGQMVAVSTTQPVTLGIGGGALSLNSNAFVLIMDAGIPTAGLTITNSSGSTTTIKTMLGGT
jgi:hypothetical protein